MTWGEVDGNDATWIAPASRIKAGKEHRAPLTLAALALLGQPGKPDTLVVECPAKPGQSLSATSLTAVLRRLGHGELTTHGFRSTFRDWAGIVADALDDGEGTMLLPDLACLARHRLAGVDVGLGHGDHESVDIGHVSLPARMHDRNTANGSDPKLFRGEKVLTGMPCAGLAPPARTG